MPVIIWYIKKESQEENAEKIQKMYISVYAQDVNMDIYPLHIAIYEIV